MKNKMLSVNRLLSVLFITTLVFTSVSCSDDDKVSCSKVAIEYINLSFELYDENTECNEIDAIGEKLIKTVRKGKSCDFVQDLMNEYEVDNIDDYIDILESQIQDIKGGLCNPA